MTDTVEVPELTPQEKRERLTELEQAIEDHHRTYPHGDWKAANERISAARFAIDAAFGIRTCGFLGNAQVLKQCYEELDKS